MLRELGVEVRKDGSMSAHTILRSPFSAAPGYTKLYKVWNDQWKKWKAPYDSRSYEHSVACVGGSWLMQTYWLFSVMERAKTTQSEKLIQVWEGDTYRQANGKVMKMRACDHKVIQDLSAEVYLPPDQQRQPLRSHPITGIRKPPIWGSCTGFPPVMSSLDGPEARSLQGEKTIGANENAGQGTEPLVLGLL
jgi:hypothetical protein